VSFKLNPMEHDELLHPLGECTCPECCLGLYCSDEEERKPDNHPVITPGLFYLVALTLCGYRVV
jgi:hypothetical protein